jgi:hypothetical protein
MPLARFAQYTVLPFLKALDREQRLQVLLQRADDTLAPIPPVPFVALGMVAAHVAKIRGKVVDRYESELSGPARGGDEAEAESWLMSKQALARAILRAVVGALAPIATGSAATPAASVSTRRILFLREDPATGLEGLYSVRPDGTELHRDPRGAPRPRFTSAAPERPLVTGRQARCVASLVARIDAHRVLPSNQTANGGPDRGLYVTSIGTPGFTKIVDGGAGVIDWR